jgi:hypothetical protein
MDGELAPPASSNTAGFQSPPMSTVNLKYCEQTRNNVRPRSGSLKGTAAAF